MGANKNFFNELREGEEYYNVFMTKDSYLDTPKHFRDNWHFNEVQQKETKELKEDPLFCELVKKVRKAKKELRDYKFRWFNK